MECLSFKPTCIFLKPSSFIFFVFLFKRLRSQRKNKSEKWMAYESFYLFKGKIIYENWIEIWKQNIFLAHNHNCVILIIIFIKIDINAVFGCNLYGTIFHFTYFVNFLQITIPLKTRSFTFYNWAWYMDSRV